MSMYWMLLCLCVCGHVLSALATGNISKKEHQRTFCDENEDRMEICQRCAKATKSPIAFPQCCNNTNNAVQWCRDYVYYGLQTQDNDPGYLSHAHSHNNYSN